jgi:hypothetical protein
MFSTSVIRPNDSIERTDMIRPDARPDLKPDQT